MKNKKLKIVWISYCPYSLYIEFFNSLGKFLDLDLIMLLSKKFLRRKIKNKNFNIIFNDVIDLANFRYFKNLEKKLKTLKPNIVISNLIYNVFTWQAFYFCKKNNIPFFIATEIKNNQKNIFKKIITKFLDKIIVKKMLSNSNLILPWTQSSRNYLLNNFKIDDDKIIYFPIGIDTNNFYLNKQKHFILNKKIKLLVIARMVSNKDYDTLLKAIKYIKDNYFFDFQLDLLGEGSLKNKIKRIINDYKLKNEVNFLNRVTYSQIKNIYDNHDVLILPSYKEPIGRVVPEAMACGLPVIVSDLVGTKDYIIEGKNGLIFKARDYKDLANKILSISNMDLKKMGKNASEHILKNFEINKVAKDFYKIIKNTK